MQIFCDESGGTDAANDVFLVAAVSLEGTEPARLLKSFRKATSLKGEIRGRLLSVEQRRIFFQLLTRSQLAGSVVITCHRKDVLGGWVMGTMSEARLYSLMLQEACGQLISENAQVVTITPDSGRYKKSVLSQISNEVKTSFSSLRASMIFEDSASLPGLQVADVIANSVFQMLNNSLNSEETATLLKPLIESGLIVVQHVDLSQIRPALIDKEYL